MTDTRTKTYGTLLWILSLPLSAGAAYLFGKNTDEMLFAAILSGLGLFAVLFLYMQEVTAKALDYDNAYHARRFLVLLSLLFLVSLVLPFLPVDIWPYPVMFLILGLFSDAMCGLFAGSVLLLLSAYLAGADAVIVFAFLLSGLLALALFRHMDEGFSVSRPMGVSCLFIFVLLTGYHLLYEQKNLSMQVMLNPAINVFAFLVLSSIVLNYFGRHVVRRSNDMYMEINDQEYELMTDLKERNKEAYSFAIHSAYLAERIAIDLGLDVRATKACAYYHEVCKELGKEEGAAAFAREKHFPEGAVSLIDEYVNPPKTGYTSREAAVINICETLVKMLNSIFAKDKTAKVDYDAMIDKIFEHHWQKGDLLLNNLSFGDMTRMKTLLKKEKLYYDFLR